MKQQHQQQQLKKKKEQQCYDATLRIGEKTSTCVVSSVKARIEHGGIYFTASSVAFGATTNSGVFSSSSASLDAS